jgi:hypothetical protein
MSAASSSTAEAVERAIRLAQDAVRADEEGDIDGAIKKYTESVDLINLGLQMQREEEEVDNTVLHKYSRLYSDRIAELKLSRDAPDAVGQEGGWEAPGAGGAGADVYFAFEESEMSGATPPGPVPSGADHWRLPFWMMRTLRNSMLRGGYLSPDKRVFVPRRVWVQKGARFTALAAKSDCAQCLSAELVRLRTIVTRQPLTIQKELERLGETLDALQNSMARLLPFVPEPHVAGSEASSNALGKITERFKGLGKVLDKTAARLGALPSKCADPSDYIALLVSLFDDAAFVEQWLERHIATPLDSAHILERLHRAATFLYEVICAFVVQDLDGLLQRHMRKASSAFLKG